MEYGRMTFQECFQEAVRKSGRSFYQIQLMTGIEQSYIFKIAYGKRFPQDRELVLKILKTLQCSESDRACIVEAWQRGQVEQQFGKKAWECMRQWQAFFHFSFQSKEVYPVRFDVSESVHLPVVDGKRNVMEALYFLIQQEMRNVGQHRIAVWGTEHCQYLSEFWAFILGEYAIELRHIVSFWQSNGDGCWPENIEVFRRILPCISQRKDYLPRYETRDRRGDDLKDICCGMILFRDTVVCLTAHDCAFILRSQEQAVWALQKFEMRFEQCAPLLREEDKEEYVADVRTVQEAASCYLLDHEISLLGRLPEEKLREYSGQDENQLQRLLRLHSLCDEKQRVNAMALQEYISMDVLRCFMDTGVLLRQSMLLSKPVLPEDRFRILDQLVKKKRHRIFFLDEAQFTVDGSISAICLGKDGYHLRLRRIDQSEVFLLLSEPEMAASLYEFFCCLGNGSFCCSQEMIGSFYERQRRQYGEKDGGVC